MLRPKVKPSKTRIVNVLYAKKAVCECGSINQFVISEMISQDFVSDYLWLIFGVVCTLANLTKKLWTIKMVKATMEWNPFFNFDINFQIWPPLVTNAPIRYLWGGFVKLFGITIISNDTYLEGFNHKNQDTPWNFDTVWEVKIFLLKLNYSK